MTQRGLRISTSGIMKNVMHRKKLRQNILNLNFNGFTSYSQSATESLQDDRTTAAGRARRGSHTGWCAADGDPAQILHLRTKAQMCSFFGKNVVGRLATSNQYFLKPMIQVCKVH